MALPLKNNKLKIRILGIDPGSIVTGYGVIDSDGMHSVYVASEPIRVQAETLPERLKLVFEGVTAVIREHRPEVVAIEKVFVKRNFDSVLKLGQARGAAIAAAVMQGLPVSEYTPRHIKQAVVGKGSASKEQVQHMVRTLLNCREELQPDEADALAVALCHGHIGGTLGRIAEFSRPTAHKRKRR